MQAHSLVQSLIGMAGKKRGERGGKDPAASGFRLAGIQKKPRAFARGLECISRNLRGGGMNPLWSFGVPKGI